jgi:hypothetical protein
VPDETPDPQLNAFARSLAATAPHPGGLDRDALLFAAGRAAQARHGRVWRVGTLLFALTSASLGAALAMRPASVVEVERVVYVPAPAPATSAPARAAAPVAMGATADAATAEQWSAGVRLRDRALREGIAGLPAVYLSSADTRLPPLSERDIPEISALRPADLHSLTGEPIR